MLRKISVVLLITLTIMLISAVGVSAAESQQPNQLPYMLPSLTWVQNEVEKRWSGETKPMYYCTSYRGDRNPKILYIYASDKPLKFNGSNFSEGYLSLLLNSQTLYKLVYTVNSDRTFEAYYDNHFSKDYYSKPVSSSFFGTPQYTNNDILIGDTGLNFQPPRFSLNSTISQPMADLTKGFSRDVLIVSAVGLAILGSLLAVFLIKRLINWAV